MRYQVLITYEGPDEKVKALYKSPGDGTKALIQEIYETAREGRFDREITLTWKEGSEVV